MSVENWAEIRRLHSAEKTMFKAIVRKLVVSRNAVRRALAADAPPQYVRPSKGSSINVVELQIRALLMTDDAGDGDRRAAGPRHPARQQRRLPPPQPRRPAGRGPPDLQTVPVTLGGKAVRRHERCWARHQNVTDPQHAQVAADLRASLSAQRRQPKPTEQQIEARSPSDDDTAFGFDSFGLDLVALGLVNLGAAVA